MKAGNATPGNWELWVGRQDTHSGLKRQVDKGKENQGLMGKWHVFWVLKIYCMGREGKDGRTGHRDGPKEGETARKTSLLLGDLSRGRKRWRRKKMEPHSCLYTPVLIFLTTNYKLHPYASLKIRYSTFIKNRASPCSTYPHRHHRHRNLLKNDHPRPWTCCLRFKH